MNRVSVFRRVIQRQCAGISNGLKDCKTESHAGTTYSGFGADVNAREAFKRFRAAAKNELLEAQYAGSYGLLWKGNKSKSTDCTAAVASAATSGYAEAQYMMGYFAAVR